MEIPKNWEKERKKKKMLKNKLEYKKVNFC